MASADADENQYVLNRDYRAVIRLNYHHWLVVQLFGYLVHPSIQSSLGDSARIADVGAGTCAWAVEVSGAHPKSQVHAFDVSNEQYPPKEWLPDNLSLHVHDAFQPFPEEHLGKYDLVHVQFFITIVRESDPLPLIKNLITLLRPGGYLQWVEGDPTSSRIVKVSESTITTATEAMYAFMKKPRATANPYSWIPHLPDSFKEEGLGDAQQERKPIKNEYRAFWNQANIMTYEEFCLRMVNGTSEEAREEGRKRIDGIAGVVKEFHSGVSLHADILCAIARKPL